MDLVLIPLTLSLYARVIFAPPLFPEEILVDELLWRYSVPPQEANIFDVHTGEPDESPPQFMDATTTVVCVNLFCLD